MLWKDNMLQHIYQTERQAEIKPMPPDHLKWSIITPPLGGRGAAPDPGNAGVGRGNKLSVLHIQPWWADGLTFLFNTH